MTEPGALVVTIDDRIVTIDQIGGGSFEMPVGPMALLDDPLADGDPPPPASLTNALGLVTDHLDDVIIEAPSVAATPGVTVVGTHALVLAQVEVGHGDLPAGYVLARDATDEVFRTVALEPRDDRRHNPGLPASHVESILGTCCVILGVMRRLELHHVAVLASPPEWA